MKKKLNALAVFALLAVALSGCYHHTYTVGSGAPDGELVYKNWHHHWIFGIIRPDHQKNLEMDEICPSGNATILQKTSFVNGLVGALTWFVYGPTTVTVLCGDGTETAVTLSAEEVEQIAHDPLFREVVIDVAPERLAEVDAALRTERLASTYPPARAH